MIAIAKATKNSGNTNQSYSKIPKVTEKYTNFTQSYKNYTQIPKVIQSYSMFPKKEKEIDASTARVVC